MKSPKISIIICSIDAGKFIRVSECYKSLMAGTPFEIIGIHDATSLAEGYNRGIEQATGDILIFSHDDITIIDPDFAAKIIDRLHNFDLLGFAGASKLVNANWFGAGQPHLHGAVCHAPPKARKLGLSIWGAEQWPVVGGIKALDGLCLISTRETARAVGFDAGTFDGFHLYDIDFSFACHQAGYKLGVCCDIPIIHESGGNFDQVHREYALRFLEKYYNQLDPFDSEAARNNANRRPLGRSGLFLDSEELRRTWCREVFTRATIAIKRPPVDLEHQQPTPQGTSTDWWQKYLPS